MHTFESREVMSVSLLRAHFLHLGKLPLLIINIMLRALLIALVTRLFLLITPRHVDLFEAITVAHHDHMSASLLHPI